MHALKLRRTHQVRLERVADATQCHVPQLLLHRQQIAVSERADDTPFDCDLQPPRKCIYHRIHRVLTHAIELANRRHCLAYQSITEREPICWGLERKEINRLRGALRKTSIAQKALRRKRNHSSAHQERQPVPHHLCKNLPSPSRLGAAALLVTTPFQRNNP